MTDVLDTLAFITTDPAAAARSYGALTCRCSFCGLALTDAGSVAVGYGPVCAKSWNLPHTPHGTPTLTPVGSIPMTAAPMPPPPPASVVSPTLAGHFGG